MPTYRSNALTSLLGVEKELKALVASLTTVKSKKTANRTILDAKNIVGKALLEMPSSEQYLSPVKKALTPILNTLGGLADGLASDDIAVKDFQRTVKNLNDRFIPRFRDEVDRVVKKVSAESSRVKDGVLQTDEAILEELKRVINEVTRLHRSLQSAVNSDKLNGQQISTMLQARGELAASVYESLPSGKDLDETAHTLTTLSDLCFVAAGRALTRGEVAKKDVDTLTGIIADLNRDQRAIEKKARNNILTYDEEKKRKPISAKKPVKETELPMTRSAEEHLKEKISNIKSKKSELPKRLKGPYQFLRSPVVAIFNSKDDIAKRDRPSGPGTVTQNFSKGKLLEQFGIDYVMLEDYVILQNQMLLAIDRAALEKLAKESMGKRKKKITDPIIVEYANQMLDVVNERGSEKYVMVSRTFAANPRNAKIILFWVMPSRILSSLIARGWNKMAEWSLPFDP